MEQTGLQVGQILMRWQLLSDVNLVGKSEQMQIEQSDVVMHIVVARLDGAIGAQQVGFEKWRDVSGIGEQVDWWLREEVGEVGTRHSQDLMESHLLGTHEINFLLSELYTKNQ